EHYAESKKHAFYDEDFKGTQFTFAALVLESTGGINDEGLGLLRQLFRFAAKREGVHLSVYCGRAWARLACNLQSSVSQAILNRVGGVGLTMTQFDLLSFCFVFRFICCIAPEPFRCLPIIN